MSTSRCSVSTGDPLIRLLRVDYKLLSTPRETSAPRSGWDAPIGTMPVAGWFIVNRRDFSDEGDAWDGSTWVDVGDDGRWYPSVAERTRAFVLLGVLVGLLLLVAAVSSLGDGDMPEVAPATTGSTTTEVQSTTTTQPLPSSLDGEAPPEECRSDDRDSQALRDPSELSVTVLNGARVGGLAGDTSDELSNLGYDAKPDDAEATVETSVTYAAGFCAEAVELASALGVPAEVVEGTPEGGSQLVVMLGSDHHAD